jgi:SAM-dependent methyltransferase
VDGRDQVVVGHRGVHQLEAAIEDAELAPGSFDAVVVTLALCSVREPAVVLRRVRELLVPDGRLLLLEHVAGAGVRGRVQQVVAPVWRRVAGGCNPDRDTLAAVRAAGFLVTDLERFSMPKANAIVRPCIQAVARPAAR